MKVKCEENICSLGKLEPKMSSHLPKYPSHTLQAQKTYLIMKVVLCRH